jgi:hypothetical protein
MTLDSTGNLGIGVTDMSVTGANAKLAVAGVVNLSDAAALAWGGGTGRASITGSKASATLLYGLPASGTHSFVVGGATVGTITRLAVTMRFLVFVTT